MALPIPAGWTDEILEALPQWLRPEFGLEPEAPPVPPPNLPGYAPLPGIGGGYQPPAPPAPEPAPAEPPFSWRAATLGAVAGGLVVSLLWAVDDAIKESRGRRR